MQKRIKPIVVILIIAVSLLALCGGALAKEIIDSGDDSEKAIKPEIEEEDAIIIADPPFITYLKSKRFYYDFKNVNILTGVDGDSGYTARNFAVNCTYTMWVNGMTVRDLNDFSTNKWFNTVTKSGVNYGTDRNPIGRLVGAWHKMDDYSVWEAIDTGTGELRGETLQYIDYSNHRGGITRCFLKDGDVYAMWDVRYSNGNSAITATYVSNATGNPSSSYFTHPQNWTDLFNS